jgi:energy-coupling factor transporter ATP-binding protein EcfA2
VPSLIAIGSLVLFTRIHLENWKNFTRLDVPLRRRTFVVGPNASGKSNLLDAMRFLRDIAEPQGGLQRAMASRHGISQIRSLHARRYPAVVVEVDVQLGDESWTYRLELSQDNNRVPQVQKEIVQFNGRPILERPNKDDKSDTNRLTQTHIEQVNSNKDFRVLAEFLTNVRYLHLVPQLIREPDRVRREEARSVRRRFPRASHLGAREDAPVALPPDRGGAPRRSAAAQEARAETRRPRRSTPAWPLRALAPERRMADRRAVLGRHTTPAWPSLGPPGRDCAGPSRRARALASLRGHSLPAAGPRSPRPQVGSTGNPHDSFCRSARRSRHRR